MPDTKKVKQINLEEIIREKNPRLLKILPGFVIRYIKRIIHQDEFNDFLHLTKDEYAHDFVKAALKFFEITVQCEGLENIPDQGGCIVVSNHPLGGIDGIAVMNGVGQRREDIKALVNDLLMNLENVSSLLVPINKHAKNLTENVKLIEQSYASDECIIIFPAGMVSRKQKEGIKDLEWKKSFISKSIKYKQKIIPIYVEASNSRFFYNLGAIRKKMGVKANLEMFYLVDEVFKQKGKTIKLTVGKPISYSSFTKEKSTLEWAQKVKEHVYTLKINNNKIF